MLTRACQELVDATPLDHRQGAVKAYIELTVYEKHAGIAVSEVSGPNGARRIAQRVNMQLNSVDELENVVTAIVERMSREVGSGTPTVR
jgi:hypothetical protein